MANKQKGEVAISALGRDLTLKFSTNALCELEDLTGKSAIEVANSLDDEKSVTMKLLRQLVYSGLLHNDGDQISLKDTGEIIDEIGHAVIGEKIAEAFVLAFPAPEDGKESDEGKS